MARKLDGKVAAVTGGGRGIGRGICLLLASEGAKVVVNDIFREADGAAAADNVVKEIQKAGGKALAAHENIATMAGGANMVKTAADAFGRIDILVNVAGNTQHASNVDLSEQEWDSVIDVHVKGHFSCCKAAMPYMIRQKSGRIINFASRGAFFGLNLAYSSAKAAVMGFSSTMAREMKPHNVTVNCILPSAITQLFPHPEYAAHDKSHPAGALRPGPEFLAPVVAYLCTDEARDITGKFIYACGGEICIYTQPLQFGAVDTMARKDGMWTIDELAQVIPSMIGEE
ncbi:MAG: SDR family NAD(P)-dependent oxidoreductase [Chloroflexi bacterium]|nr:SDR family NAD(P)-dependent oxidoreductase [Chloroflexota bacterium]